MGIVEKTLMSRSGYFLGYERASEEE